jgi:hypothetical protein
MLRSALSATRKVYRIGSSLAPLFRPTLALSSSSTRKQIHLQSSYSWMKKQSLRCSILVHVEHRYRFDGTMVNRGPSVACHACRERRVGCDRARPACKKCLARGHICPGYRDAGGVVFKDQSQAVYARHSRSRSTALPTQLRSNPHDVTTAFFFRQCVLPTRQEWPLGNEYFEHILPLYNSVAPKSALATVVSVMALKVATVHHSPGYVQPLVSESELRAVRAVNAALSNPLECLKDETLLAVLCLDFAQQFVRRSASRQHDRPHLKGALALLRHRRPETFDSDVSRSLYVATRSHVLLHSLWSGNESQDQDLVLTLPGMEVTGESPASAIQHILQRVLCLERELLLEQAKDTGESSGEDAQSLYSHRAQVLCDCLKSHRDRVSWNSNAAIVSLPPGSFERAGDAYSIRQAFVFGQYICTYLLALKLLFSTTKLRATNDEEPKSAHLQAISDQTEALATSLCTCVIPVLDLGRYLVQASEQDLERTINTETRPELVNGIREDGLASVSRSHLVCILTWAWAILTEEMHGAEEFGDGISANVYLKMMYESISPGFLV